MSKRSVKNNGSSQTNSAVMSQNEPQSSEPPDESAVAELAYRRWVEKGCPQGTAEDDWFEAERDLRTASIAMHTGE